jgi:hypothetical protein
MNLHQTRVSVETVLPLCSTLKFGHPVKEVCAFLRNRPSRLARKRELASDITCLSCLTQVPLPGASSVPSLPEERTNKPLLQMHWVAMHKLFPAVEPRYCTDSTCSQSFHKNGNQSMYILFVSIPYCFTLT